VIELVKVPVPVPFVVRESAVVGFGEVFQQTPRSVTAPSPFEVTFPPHEAVVLVMRETGDVAMTGSVTEAS
jgi:hypothetical protein